MSTETSPYAPPSARVADVAPNKHGLKYRSLWAMVLLLFGSLGIYYLVWFFRRRTGLNQLDSSRKVPLWPLLLTAAYYGVTAIFGFLEGLDSSLVPIGDGGSAVMTFFELVIGLMMVVLAFRIKDIIQDHAMPPPGAERWLVEEVQLSGLMTFFFSIFYLQWAINKYVVGGRDGQLLRHKSMVSEGELARIASGT